MTAAFKTTQWNVTDDLTLPLLSNGQETYVNFTRFFVRHNEKSIFTVQKIQNCFVNDSKPRKLLEIAPNFKFNDWQNTDQLLSFDNFLLVLCRKAKQTFLQPFFAEYSKQFNSITQTINETQATPEQLFSQASNVVDSDEISIVSNDVLSQSNISVQPQIEHKQVNAQEIINQYIGKIIQELESVNQYLKKNKNYSWSDIYSDCVNETSLSKHSPKLVDFVIRVSNKKNNTKKKDNHFVNVLDSVVKLLFPQTYTISMLRTSMLVYTYCKNEQTFNALNSFAPILSIEFVRDYVTQHTPKVEHLPNDKSNVQAIVMDNIQFITCPSRKAVSDVGKTAKINTAFTVFQLEGNQQKSDIKYEQVLSLKDSLLKCSNNEQQSFDNITMDLFRETTSLYLTKQNEDPVTLFQQFEQTAKDFYKVKVCPSCNWEGLIT